MGRPADWHAKHPRMPSDEELLRRSVRKAARSNISAQELAWARVRNWFAVGSTSAAALCVRFGIDPDTGAALVERPRATPAYRDEGGAVRCADCDEEAFSGARVHAADCPQLGRPE